MLQPRAVWKCSCYSCPSPSSVIPNTCIVGVGLTSLSMGTPHLTVLISIPIPIPIPISIPYPIPIPIPGTRCLRDLCRAGTTGNASHVPMTRGALPGSVHKHRGTVPAARGMSTRSERHARGYLPAHCAQGARGHRGSRRDLGPGDGHGHRHGASAHRAGRVRQPCGSAGLATHGVLTRVRSYGTGMREAQGAHESGAVRARYARDWHCSGWAVPTCCWFTSRPRDVAPGRKLQPQSCLSLLHQHPVPTRGSRPSTTMVVIATLRGVAILDTLPLPPGATTSCVHNACGRTSGNPSEGHGVVRQQRFTSDLMTV